MKNRNWARKGGRHRPLQKRPLAPLRKIVAMWSDWPSSIMQELLECGHVVQQRSDIIGPTNAYRRRCRRCLKGDPPDRDVPTNVPTPSP